ncbi:hypothetical protein PAHAL_9G559300 [Panicum hallii]|jgi:hypothetical protein|uniref:3-beta hydroxysteroid dehydrogenase/isomerase domain-containing protein n=1 Tax=Panicum hallii TaxID=206008 RepID=A0A2T8I5X4_9POAL|nr:hypothetical protein PAHAL_9G559300 [Panicum hallii]
MTMRVVAGDGYLGARLCAAVAVAGHDVRAFVLHGVNLLGPPFAAGVAYGDVADEESLIAAFDGCDAVFDAARTAEAWLPTPPSSTRYVGAIWWPMGRREPGFHPPDTKRRPTDQRHGKETAAAREGLFGK